MVMPITCSLAESPDHCPVCQQDLYGEAFDRSLAIAHPCGHLFHTDCIASWLSDHLDCPVARRIVTTLDEQSYPPRQIMLPLPNQWQTLLLSSAREGDTATVEALLLRGANADDGHDSVNAPFLLAVENGYLDTALLLAQHGATSALAQYKLGYRYLKGTGVDVNLPEAIRWLTKSAHQKFAPAWNQLGWIYQYGESIPRNLSAAEHCYRHGALLEYSPAKVNLALMLLNEHNPRHNTTEAVEWLLSAANQGNVYAQDSLGVCLMRAIGVAKNAREALRWFSNAALLGYPLAQFHLGEMYFLGEGVHSDLTRAQQWFRLAAEKGLGLAQSHLGKLLLTGQGGEKDPIEAQRWLLEAARKGDAEALYLMSWIHLNDVISDAEPAVGLTWLCISADRGCSLAQRDLGRFYLCPGPQQDLSSASYWLQKAKEGGDHEACQMLEKISQANVALINNQDTDKAATVSTQE